MSFLLDVRRMWAGRGRDEMSGVLSMSRVSLVTVWPSPSVSMGTHHTSHCLSHRCHTNTGIKTCDTQLTNSHDPVTHENIGLCIWEELDRRAASEDQSTHTQESLSDFLFLYCWCGLKISETGLAVAHDGTWDMRQPPGVLVTDHTWTCPFITNNHTGIVYMVFTIFLKLICNDNPLAGESFLTKTQHCMASLKP